MTIRSDHRAPPPGYGYCIGGQVYLVCLKCGSVVCDSATHDKWHTDVEDL